MKPQQTAIFAASLTLLAACGTTTEQADAPTPATTASAGATTPAPMATWGAADKVLAAFVAAGLPAANPVDNTLGCLRQGCDRALTTDTLTIVSFLSAADALAYAKAWGPELHLNKRIVLAYAPQKTPEVDRPRYEAVLDKVT